MTPTGSRLNLPLVWTTLALAISVLGSAAVAVNTWRIGHVSVSAKTSSMSGASASSLATAPTDVLADLGLGVARSNADPVQDIRLVGTYFVYDEMGTNSVRHAIVAGVNNSIQSTDLVVGDQIAGYGVTKIERDVVTVERLADRAIFLLRLASPDAVKPGGREMASGGRPGDPSRVARAMSFGGQIASNHWVMNRQELMSYYQELRDDPVRLVKVFDTMKPLRDAAGKITGYTVGIEGEKEFFDAVGLHEGDVVRKANGRPMTNRRFAEQLIASGVRGDANAFVLEVERNGVTDKQTYQIR